MIEPTTDSDLEYIELPDIYAAAYSWVALPNMLSQPAQVTITWDGSIGSTDPITREYTSSPSDCAERGMYTYDVVIEKLIPMVMW